MKTRPYLLIVLSILVSKTTTFAQVTVPPISGWDLDEKSGSYTLKPAKAASVEGKEFIYEIMPIAKSEGQPIEQWFSTAIDKDVTTSGFVIPATSKKNITTNQTIISLSTEATDKKGKAWYVTYVAYEVGDGDTRMARIMCSPDVRYYANNMRPVAEHFGNLNRLDATASASGKFAKINSGHNKQETKAPVSSAQSEAIPEKGLKTQEINGILIHLEYNNNADGKMVRIYKPYLVLNDGSIYSEPVISPYSLDVAASKTKEPKKWGTWKLKNGSFLVEWTSTNETEKWFKNWFWATPSQKDEKLDGSFMTVNGAENGNVKSSDKAYTSKFIFFNKDGQFTLTGGDGATVPASEYKKYNEAGTYTLNDYSMELHFNNGTVIRRMFYFYLQGSTHFGIGNAVYAPKQAAVEGITGN